MHMASYCCIWNHRNNVNFRNAKGEDEEVFMLAQNRVWAWITNNYSTTPFSYTNWCLCLITCDEFIFMPS